MSIKIRQPHARQAARGDGFSLVELIMAILIVGFVAGASFPILIQMNQSFRIKNSKNAIKAAVREIHILSTRDRQGRFADILPGVPGQYNGTALIFTPTNQILFTENTPKGQFNAPGQFIDPGGTPYSPTDFLELKVDNSLPARHANAFEEIPNIDFVQLPELAGVVGIIRVQEDFGGPPSLLAPPFAVRFDEEGILLTAGQYAAPYNPFIDVLDRYVFFDKDFDGLYNIRDNRPATYNPDDWNPEISTVPFNNDVKQYELPFEALEPVIGVVVFDLSEMRAQGLGLEADGTTKTDGTRGLIEANAQAWIWANGEILLFGRLSGTVGLNKQTED